MKLFKWLPTLAPIFATVGIAIAPTAQAYIALHPLAATVCATLYAILAHLCPHPLTGNGS